MTSSKIMKVSKDADIEITKKLSSSEKLSIAVELSDLCLGLMKTGKGTKKGVSGNKP